MERFGTTVEVEASERELDKTEKASPLPVRRPRAAPLRPLAEAWSVCPSARC